MNFHDPTSYTDLTQGRIKHINFHIQVDFSAHMLDIEATYQMQDPVNGSLYLDTFKIEMKDAYVNGRKLEWEFDRSDEVLGKRLHLHHLMASQLLRSSLRPRLKHAPCSG